MISITKIKDQMFQRFFERRIIMKVMNITNIDKFFGVIDQCEDKVELVTGNGDRLNLKSKLSQYVSVAKLCFGGKIPELELITHNPKDTHKILCYMMYSNR